MAGNLIAMVAGVVFMFVGVVLTLSWREDFFQVLRGCLGPAIAFVGLLAIIIGYSEFKATREFEAATAGAPEPAPEPAPAPTPEPAPASEESAS